MIFSKCLKGASQAFIFIMAVFAIYSCKVSDLPDNKSIEVHKKEVVFNPNKVSKKINNNLSLEIEPVNAPDLNLLFYNMLNRTGKYVYETASVNCFYDQKEKSGKMTKDEKVLSKIRSSITKLKNTNAISSKVADIMLRVAVADLQGLGSEGYDGSEVVTQFQDEMLKEVNPLKFKDEYANSFKLIFENTSDVVELVRLEDFNFVCGGEENSAIKPIVFSEINKDFASNTRVLLNYYMPETLKVMPYTKVSKYISIPSLNTFERNLDVFYVNGSTPVKYSFGILDSVKTNNYMFSLFNFKAKRGGFGSFYWYAIVIETKNGLIFPTKEMYTYILKEQLSEPINIYSVGLPTNGRKIMFGKCINVTPGQLPEKEIEIPYESY